MKEWVAIVDMDQPNHRMPVAITGEDDFSCAAFESTEAIKKLHDEHSLGIFTWWALNFTTGEVEEIF